MQVSMPFSLVPRHLVFAAVSAFAGGCQPLPVDSDAVEDSDVPGPSLSPIAVGSFNTESGGSVPDVVAEVIAEVKNESLWGFVEVEYDDAAEVFVAAAADDGQNFDYFIGTTGGADRIVAAWDDDRFESVRSFELDDLNIGGYARSPVVVELRERETDLEFLFLVNHLWRSDEDGRHDQAAGLNEWARDQELPILAVGDYNFDWSIEDDEHDAGYDLMTEDGVFEWIRPDPLEKTHCSGYRSVLDFVFVGGDFRDWAGESEVLQATNAYCVESDERSDHRPVWAEITPP